MNIMFYKVNWDEIFDKINTNQCYEYFLKVYEKACKQYIPHHFKPTSSIQNPCINIKIKNLIRKKRNLWCRVRATNFKNTNLNNEYKLVNKMNKKQIKKSTLDHEINLAKDYLPKKIKIYHISSIKQCNEDIVHNYLLELNENKSLGCDSISAYVLKHSAERLSKPLSLILKKSIHSGEMPELWKSANIASLFKKGDKEDPLNYRPISLISIQCKIIEKMTRKKLIIYITENKLLKPQQHGFVQNKGCLTNLLETFDIITTEIEDDYPVDILFLDFAKAFDKVPHHRLIYKISNYGIKGNILNWIDFLKKNRKQRVVMSEAVSDCFTCDTPTRAMIKCIKSHSGYFRCDKCRVEGEWSEKVTFQELNAPLRTDNQFSRQVDEDHHLGLSPLSA
ncbi:uncharacterized protein LOC136085296 [Hydra vulgaris]|uniref:Uncharacterized protein LOC136085296 n=1 Tax=Hydra vulgaris TaxID=6087 RepID=A0ABM4CLK0_HYDVU